MMLWLLTPLTKVISVVVFLTLVILIVLLCLTSVIINIFWLCLQSKTSIMEKNLVLIIVHLQMKRVNMIRLLVYVLLRIVEASIYTLVRIKRVLNIWTLIIVFYIETIFCWEVLMKSSNKKIESYSTNTIWKKQF